MENYKKKIEEILAQTLTEKTFSLEIVDKIKTLKDDFESSQKLIDSLREKSLHNEKMITNLEERNTKLQELVNSYTIREKEISDKEKKLEKTNYELQFQTKRGDEIKELFGIVFKNPIVREGVYKTGNNNNDYFNETKTVTKELE